MKVYLGLGSNLGDKKSNIDYAIRKIDDLAGRVLNVSDYYTSKPQGFESANNFVNVAIGIETKYNPHELLQILQDIEKKMGRKTKTHKAQYVDRIIDIDILLYENITINTADLTIPHPLMKERDFVMIPLQQIMFDI